MKMESVVHLAISCWMWIFTSSIIAGEILRYVYLNCVVSYNSIRCFTLFVVPISVELVENISGKVDIRKWRDRVLALMLFFLRQSGDILVFSKMIFRSGLIVATWYSISKQVRVHTNLLIIALQLPLW